MANNLVLPAAFSVPDLQANYDPIAVASKRQRMVLIAVAVLVFGFGIAGALVPISGAVVASGQVGMESRVKRIAHPTGGVIKEILVTEGQRVRKGQILMRFDDSVSGTEAEYSSLSVDQMLAQRARLEAERIGANSIDFPKQLIRNDESARKAIADEQRMFTVRRQEQSAIVSQLESRVRQYEQQIGAYNSQIGALHKQEALIEPERRGVKELWDKGLVTISRLNQLERTSADMEGNIGAMHSNIAQTQARITEARQQIIQMGETRRSDAGTQLAALNATLNQQVVRSASAVDTRDRSVVRAPYDGVVDKLAVNSIGGVVKPAEVVMEIVPVTDKMIVEGVVAPDDVEQVEVGRKARIRFSAFNSPATPEIGGMVTFLAAERTVDPDGRQAYFPIRVAIDQNELRKHPELALRPGMPAEIFISTGSRSMLSYVTKPLQDQFARAFKDN